MAREVSNRTVIRDFPGEQDDFDPMDIPEGAAQTQLNLASKTAGQLESRRGFRFAGYDSATLVATLTAD